LRPVLDSWFAALVEVESRAIDFLVAPQARRRAAVKGGASRPGGTRGPEA
jgi:hypothetical protein